MTYDIPERVQKLGADIQEHQLRYHNRTVLVSKEFTFDSAHHLHCYEGKCKSLHGHTYKVQIILAGKTDRRGIAIDFADIKRIAKARIVDRLDHRYLNEVLPPMNTTAENMVVWMYEQIQDALVEEKLYPAVRIEEIKLWETPTSYAAVTRRLMEADDGE